MIKFFRKIRYDLIGQNKTGKYFKYAIGEIILVVIGIFIAIQLNNINEERKLQNKEGEYYCKLLEDIQQDIIQNEKLIIVSEKRIKSSNELLSLLQEDSLNSELIANKALEAVSLITYTFKPNKAAFEDLKSSGNLAILKDEKIKSKISEYYTTVEGIVNVIDNNANGQLRAFYDKSNYAHFGFHQIEFLSKAIDTTIVNKSKLNAYIKLDENYRAKLTSDAVIYIGSSARVIMLYNDIKKEIIKMKSELERKCNK
jgi:hypothetical protein